MYYYICMTQQRVITVTLITAWQMVAFGMAITRRPAFCPNTITPQDNPCSGVKEREKSYTVRVINIWMRYSRNTKGGSAGWHKERPVLQGTGRNRDVFKETRLASAKFLHLNLYIDDSCDSCAMYAFETLQRVHRVNWNKCG